MNNPLLNYFLIRIGIFVVALCLLLLTGMDPILAALFAAVIGFAVSLIVLNRQRDKVSEMVYKRMQRKGDLGTKEGEADVENELLDGKESGEAQGKQGE
jgi:Flp pilus assembly protein TadB